MDVSSDNIEGLASHLRRFKIRNQVSIEDISGKYKAYQLLGKNVSMEIGSDVISIVDPRSEQLGVRMVLTQNRERYLKDFGSKVEEDEYTSKRYSSIVPEVFVPGVSLPLECNFDSMRGGTDFLHD